MIAAQYTDNMQPYFDQLSASFEEANPQYDVPGRGRLLERHRSEDQDPGPDRPGARYREPELLRELRGGRPAVHGRGDRLAGGPRGHHPGVHGQLQVRGRRLRGAGPRVRPPLLLEPRPAQGRGRGEGPATWSELLAACKQIKETTPDIIPLAMPLGPEEAQAEFFIWAGGNDGGYFKDGAWVVDGPENVETLTFLDQLVDEGCTQSSPATTNRTDGAWPLFYQGKAAMTNGAIFLPSVMTEKGSTINYEVCFIANDGKSSVTLGVYRTTSSASRRTATRPAYGVPDAPVRGPELRRLPDGGRRLPAGDPVGCADRRSGHEAVRRRPADGRLLPRRSPGQLAGRSRARSSRPSAPACRALTRSQLDADPGCRDRRLTG